MLRDPGCGSSSSESLAASTDSPGSSSGGTQARETEDTSGLGAPPSVSDAGAGPASALIGSPLCNVTTSPMARCVPDEDGVSTRYEAFAVCAYAPTNNGNSAMGCRVRREDAGAAQPLCEGANTAGTDGTSCVSGTDCAPGYDCIEGDKGATCRRYCCLDACDGQAAQSGGKTFCDVQRVVGGNVVAPVCMPVKPCKLLSAGQCAMNETCSIVNASGDTGCVTAGTAVAGDSCDAEHCASGLSCIGQPGAKRCYQLCKVSAAGSCPSGTTCKTTSLFKDPAYGVCQKAMATY